MVPSQSDKTSVPDVRSAPQANSAAFSGYFTRIPDELIDRLGELSHAELKAYLVIQHGIQKDRNAGLLSTRQLLKRTGFKSMGHVERAVGKLRSSGWVIVAGGRRRTARYSNPFEFRTAKSADATGKSADVCTPPAVQSREARKADCTPAAVQNCTPPAVQPIESLKKNINLARLPSMERQKQTPASVEVLAVVDEGERIRKEYPSSDLARSGPINRSTAERIVKALGTRTVEEFFREVAARFKRGDSPYDRSGMRSWGLLYAWAQDFGAGAAPATPPSRYREWNGQPDDGPRLQSTVDPEIRRRLDERRRAASSETGRAGGVRVDSGLMVAELMQGMALRRLA